MGVLYQGIRRQWVKGRLGCLLLCRYQSNGSSLSSRIRWFYATDIPKSKPEHLHYKQEKPAEKYVPFSAEESNRIEHAFETEGSNIVSVKEDGLFQCLLKEREMGPVYWDGPTYDIRRGTWFYDETGKKLSPVAEKLATEIEALYQNIGKGEGAAEPSSLKLSSISGKIRFSKDSKSVAWITTDEDNDVLHRIAPWTDSKVVRGYYESPATDEDAESLTEEKAIPEEEESVEQRERQIESEAESRFKELFSFSKQHQERRLESQMENDYNTNLISSMQQAREVDHLILCVHGIGQKLATKIESVNFVHDINMLRKQMKENYAQSTELQSALYPGITLSKVEDDHPKKTNNRVQALPVLWRHNIQFGMTQSDRQHPDDVTLEDVNVDGVMALRNIVGDVVLDVLLYKQEHYRRQILETVTRKINDIVEEFAKRNPSFAENPQISLVGHSLGSAICFDILANQKEFALKHDVTNFFAVGSPLGLFELISKRKLDSDTLALKGSFYNVFHPCDPVAYRVEPLVDRRAAQVPPELVPYTRGGLTSQIQELSDLGSKISSSASTVWSNFTSSFTTKTEFTVQDLFRKTAGEIMDEEGKQKHKPLEEEPHEDDDAHTKEEKQKLVELKQNLQEKLAGINSSKRIDYVIQEGVLDISLIAALASHMSYFENEDVASFILKHTYQHK